MGNICRSPTAEGVFRTMIETRLLSSRYEVDSAGTHDYHTGCPPDFRAIEHALKRGYDLNALRARPVVAADFSRFDFILTMDRQNLFHLKTFSPALSEVKPKLLLDYSSKFPGADVPDPYYGGDREFELALTMIEDGCRGLIDFLDRAAGQV
jgi:protein-tyrosine phosphatase